MNTYWMKKNMGLAALALMMAFGACVAPPETEAPPELIAQVSASGTVDLLLEEKKDVLIAPAAAVRAVGEESYVFMLEDGLRVMRAVEIGMSNGKETEIVSGLTEGEEIISGGIR